MASTLPTEIVEEILFRVPPDEPAHLVRASVVCKAWYSILSDDAFRRQYRRFHGTPPLLGYICNQYSDSTVRFVPTTSVGAESAVCATKLDHDGSDWKPSALDCRHGRVLIQVKDMHSSLQDSVLIVWDPITGGQQQLRVPTYLNSRKSHSGAVLCAMEGCDHLNCHGGSFLVVLVGTSHDNIWASVYSSQTGAWSARTPNDTILYGLIDNRRPNLLIGDALYFPTIFNGNNIFKYDLRKHELSTMDTPREVCTPILIKDNNGGIGFAELLNNCIYKWSWQVGIKGVGEWMKHMIMEIDDTLLSKGCRQRFLICIGEDSNTILITVEQTGIFMLDLKSKQVRMIGEIKTYFYGHIVLPYMSFYALKY